MDGPYRDLGSGFARLSGAEAPRRAPASISCVEDALLELLRNARDAGAKNVFVASKLENRRYRTLTVIDDGCGVPEAYADLIFAAGVTSRHLDPVHDSRSPHGAGLALHHIKTLALAANLLHPRSPTSIQATFDTHTLPERSLQSTTRPSKTNLLATTRSFANQNPTLNLFHAPPSAILATLIENHIIHEKGEKEVLHRAREVGIEVSARTVRRVLRGEVRPARRVEASGGGAPGGGEAGGRGGGEGPILRVSGEDRAGIVAILERAARASYLEVSEAKFRSRPGEVSFTARVHEPEEEYE